MQARLTTKLQRLLAEISKMLKRTVDEFARVRHRRKLEVKVAKRKVTGI